MIQAIRQAQRPLIGMTVHRPPGRTLDQRQMDAFGAIKIVSGRVHWGSWHIGVGVVT
jgi:hypothetical protein